jgi:Transglycosylase SLT domain
MGAEPGRGERVAEGTRGGGLVKVRWRRCLLVARVLTTRLVWAGLAVLFLLLPCVASTARADIGDDVACARAAQAAETDFGLPQGVLRAIGRVESGGWPWIANVDGAAEVYRSKPEAVTALMRVRSPRPANIDVGCFQISSRYHPTAFPTIADALDPDSNARYAAKFLLELRDRYGDWARAVGAYHSATAPLEAAYRGQVMAQWKDGDPVVTAVALNLPRWRVIAIGPGVQPMVGVWTSTTMPTNADDGALPRIITR